MRPIAVLLIVAAVLGGLRVVSHRLATYQRIIPNPLGRINTQVHRINQ